MEWAVASIGGFCVGSHFIVEHQRLSGLGYCFSASLPPMLCQAAISALNKFEKEPKIFEELQKNCVALHKLFSKFSKLQIKGNELSPVKHLHITKALNTADEEELLGKLSDLVLYEISCLNNNVSTYFNLCTYAFYIFSAFLVVLQLSKPGTFAIQRSKIFAIAYV